MGIKSVRLQTPHPRIVTLQRRALIGGRWADFDVTVDLDDVLAELGPKAVINTRHRSIACGGAVKVEFVEWVQGHPQVVKP